MEAGKADRAGQGRQEMNGNRTGLIMSIHPQYAEMILDGVKRYEYRRRLPVEKRALGVLIYATAPVSKIVGEFVIAEKMTLQPDIMWDETGEFAGITREEFDRYFYGLRDAHALNIIQPRRYEKPATLSDYCLQRPPQSFMYI